MTIKDKILVSTLGVVMVGIVIIKNMDNEPKEYIPDAIEAYSMAKQLMERKLKAPKTAEFASYSESKVKEIVTDVWEVDSFVDSQNSFGALIRTHFKIKMVVNRQTKYWQTVSVTTDP